MKVSTFFKTAAYWVGGISIATILVLASAWFVYPAITDLAGIAVSGGTTVWNPIKDAGIQIDGVSSGLASIGLFGFNGSTWDRLRSSIGFGLQVDVTRLPGSGQTPTDGFANPTTFQGSWSLGGAFNGSTWDRLRSISATNNTASTSLGAGYVAHLGTWTLTNTPALATQATASRVAGGGTVRHVTTTVSWCLAAGGTATGPIVINLRDGASGAGTVLQSWAASTVVNGAICQGVSGLNITGSANTAMTIEFAAAGAAGTQETVNATGYDTP